MKAAAVRRRQFHLRVLAGFFVMIACAVTIVSFVLMLRGGWDDVSVFVALLAPTAALAGFMVATINIAKYRARKMVAAIPLGAVMLSGIFFVIAIIGISFTTSSRYVPDEEEIFLQANYRCTVNDAAEPTVGLIMNVDKAWKIYDLARLDYYAEGSYGAEFDAGNMRLLIRLGDNRAKDDELFNQTEYHIDKTDDGALIYNSQYVLKCAE